MPSGGPAALLSVSDRQGLEVLAAALAGRGFHLVATTGTASVLRAAGIASQEVSDLTGFPALCDGRVKTLHPRIFAGILAERENAEHVAELARYEIPFFSVVAVNLYPFEERMRAFDSTASDDRGLIDEIDIGGVTLVRAAAKNFRDVTVLVEPAQYPDYLAALARGGPTLEERRSYAAEAFDRCERYDAAIARYFAGTSRDGARERRIARQDVSTVAGSRVENQGEDSDGLPPRLIIDEPVRLRLRYGENPWAKAAFYLGQAGLPFPSQISGKELSYNNLLDVDACLRLLAPLEEPYGFPAAARSSRPVRAAIVKHTVPCGLAARDDAAEALAAALGADPISAFGGIVACSHAVDEKAAALLSSRFLEVVAAPAFDDAALRTLTLKKNLRLLTFAPQLPSKLHEAEKLRSALGGVLLEQPDPKAPPDEWRLMTERQLSSEEWRDLRFAFGAVRLVKSNAAVVVSDEVTLGICGGQTNRVAAVEIACRRAGSAVRGAALATDGFFPFADGLQAAAAAGIASVVAPSGSIRDAEVIAAARAAGMSLVFTSRRYFLH